MKRARDVMQEQVLTVGPDTPLLDVHRLFAEEQIHAAPVVDETDDVVGVISTIDLIRALDEERDTAWVESSYLRDVLPYTETDWDSVPEDIQDRLQQECVSDVMTRGVVSVVPDAPASEVAAILRKNRLHHVFVIEDGSLLGVISTFDLLQLVEESG